MGLLYGYAAGALIMLCLQLFGALRGLESGHVDLDFEPDAAGKDMRRVSLSLFHMALGSALIWPLTILVSLPALRALRERGDLPTTIRFGKDPDITTPADAGEQFERAQSLLHMTAQAADEASIHRVVYADVLLAQAWLLYYHEVISKRGSRSCAEHVLLVRARTFARRLKCSGGCGEPRCAYVKTEAP